MDFTVKHSLPGRIRIRYDKAKISRRQAALALSLLSVQEGMIDVSVNYTTGSFLIYYDTKQLSEKHIRAYFMALSDKYLKNQEMLDAVEEPQELESLLFDLACMTAWSSISAAKFSTVVVETGRFSSARSMPFSSFLESKGCLRPSRLMTIRGFSSMRS